MVIFFGVLIFSLIILLVVYYIDFLVALDCDKFNSKNEVILAAIPFYKWFMHFKNKYNKLED